MQRTVFSWAVVFGSAVLGSALHIAVARADEPVKQLILPGESFLVEGRPAFVMLPAAPKRTTPQPWVTYAPTLPGLPDEHEKWMHEQFLAAGVAVAEDVWLTCGDLRSRLVEQGACPARSGRRARDPKQSVDVRHRGDRRGCAGNVLINPNSAKLSRGWIPWSELDQATPERVFSGRRPGSRGAARQ